MSTSEVITENPRTRRVRQLMLATAVELLLEGGADELTAARVADGADVARTTVYRQWPDQDSLLLATIQELSMSVAGAPAESMGRVEGDVRVALEQLRIGLVRRSARTVYGALASRSAHDANFSDAQRDLVQQLMLPLIGALEAGVARGDLDQTTDCAFEANLLAGPLLHCHLSLHNDISNELIDEVMQRWREARARQETSDEEE